MNDHANQPTKLDSADISKEQSPIASENERREVMYKIGRYSAYATPALMAILSNKASAGS